MARNRLAGTTRGTSKTSRYYQSHPEARKVKAKYDKKYNENEQPIQKKKGAKNRRKYRTILQFINRRNGTHGNLDGKDVSHTSSSEVKSEDQSKNRSNYKKSFKNIFKPKNMRGKRLAKKSNS